MEFFLALEYGFFFSCVVVNGLDFGPDDIKFLGVETLVGLVVTGGSLLHGGLGGLGFFGLSDGGFLEFFDIFLSVVFFLREVFKDLVVPDPEALNVLF